MEGGRVIQTVHNVNKSMKSQQALHSCVLGQLHGFGERSDERGVSKDIFGWLCIFNIWLACSNFIYFPKDFSKVCENLHDLNDLHRDVMA